MTDEEFRGLKIGDVVAARPGDRYVITEVRSDGAIAVKTMQLKDVSGWSLSRSRAGKDALAAQGIGALLAGDLITEDRGVTHIVASNDGVEGVTVFVSVKIWQEEAWSLVSQGDKPAGSVGTLA